MGRSRHFPLDGPVAADVYLIASAKKDRCHISDVRIDHCSRELQGAAAMWYVREDRNIERNAMKKTPRIAVIVFALLAALALCTPVIAAQNNMGGMSPQGNNAEAMQRLEKMSAALQLTPEQKRQVAPIIMDEAPKLKALKSDTSLPPMQKAMKLRQISEATDAKMKPILNPQQYQTLMQMQAQERQQMIQKMENR